MKSGKTLVTALTAALAGILFAPRKGSVTRKKISEKSRKYAGVLSSKLKESRNSISRQLEAGKKEAQKTIEKGKEIVKGASEKSK